MRERNDSVKKSACRFKDVVSAPPLGKISAPTGEIFRAHGKVKIATGEKRDPAVWAGEDFVKKMVWLSTLSVNCQLFWFFVNLVEKEPPILV